MLGGGRGEGRGCSGPFSPWDAPEIRIRTRKIKKPAFITPYWKNELVVCCGRVRLERKR